MNAQLCRVTCYSKSYAAGDTIKILYRFAHINFTISNNVAVIHTHHTCTHHKHTHPHTSHTHTRTHTHHKHRHTHPLNSTTVWDNSLPLSTSPHLSPTAETHHTHTCTLERNAAVSQHYGLQLTQHSKFPGFTTSRTSLASLKEANYVLTHKAQTMPYTHRVGPRVGMEHSGCVVLSGATSRPQKISGIYI